MKTDVPQAADSEKGLISSCIQSPNVLAQVLERVPVDHFVSPAHQEIYLALRDMHAQGIAVDLITLTQFLDDAGTLKRCGDAAGITEIFTFVPTPANWRDYARKLLDKWKLREKDRILDSARAGDLSNSEAAEALAKLDSEGDTPQLTIRRFSELIEMEFDPTENYLGDYILCAGEPLTILGPGGLGKSRVVLQLAVCSIVGRSWLDIDTHAKGKRWLFLQTENSPKRIKNDLSKMVMGMRLHDEEVKLVDECLFFHTVENDTDAFLDVENPESARRIEQVVKAVAPDVVVLDPLNSLTSLDLNSDRDMRQVVTAISRIVKKGNPKRAIIVIHHSLTGKAGAARAIGFDKASYGRNSKVLFNWTRSQINLAPRDPEDNTLLLMTCGKNNNGKPLPEMGVVFDERRGFYTEDPDFDANAFREAVGAEKTTRAISIKPVDVASLFDGAIARTALCQKVETAFGCKQRRAYTAIHEAVEAKAIKQTTKGKWNVEYVKP